MTRSSDHERTGAVFRKLGKSSNSFGTASPPVARWGIRTPPDYASSPHDDACDQCLSLTVGRPDAGNPDIQFDEPGMGNGALPHGPNYRAHPRPYAQLGRAGMSAFTESLGG